MLKKLTLSLLAFATVVLAASSPSEAAKNVRKSPHQTVRKTVGGVAKVSSNNATKSGSTVTAVGSSGAGAKSHRTVRTTTGGAPKRSAQ